MWVHKLLSEYIMILDYFLYRAFDNFRKQKCDKENARDRCCWVMVWMLNELIAMKILHYGTIKYNRRK